MLADLAPTAVLTCTPLSLVFADAAAAAVFARVPLALVLADGGAAALFALVALSLVLTDTTAAALFTLAPHSRVFADASTATFLASAGLSLVRAEGTPAACLARSPYSLVLADAAAVAILARAPPPLVLADARTATGSAAVPGPPMFALLKLVCAAHDFSHTCPALAGSHRFWRCRCGGVNSRALTDTSAIAIFAGALWLAHRNARTTAQSHQQRQRIGAGLAAATEGNNHSKQAGLKSVPPWTHLLLSHFSCRLLASLDPQTISRARARQPCAARSHLGRRLASATQHRSGSAQTLDEHRLFGANSVEGH